MPRCQVTCYSNSVYLPHCLPHCLAISCLLAKFYLTYLNSAKAVSGVLAVKMVYYLKFDKTPDNFLTKSCNLHVILIF